MFCTFALLVIAWYHRPIWNVTKRICQVYKDIYDSYIEEYKSDNHVKEVPTQYYFYFLFSSAVYMARSAKALTMKKLERTSPFKKVVEHLDKHTAKISYEWRGHIYTIVKYFKPVEMHCLLEAHGIKAGCVEAVYKDVTVEIKKYLGPCEDWHEVELTAGRLGYKSLKISKLNSDTFDTVERTFGQNEVLLPLSRF